ncbi:hypothetical protein L226DRAFT_612445 [Lentinus tigrinus ALCF2SS1-7]|uniref:Uncharacterized protein n=1 Tax=Lentinus tigrinus ALCF2SS1-6 TaxID=1328759 RepID=A0A5C2RPU0_9APHY|nr:hypothetical protein L227DRAFT_658413 [Lentinus tigrinus ALCF2SS1-6]RPD75374.1 hypothetical protein L226DRAFT_612445 [Lentinus tigrinus ALCF2SS1-7]
MSDISYPNARLIGLWLQLFATGAYFVYLSQCVGVMRRKLREGMSLWLPLVCAVMFVLTMLVDIFNMVLAYDAFSTRPGQETNPWDTYTDVGNTFSELKNAVTVALAIISDLIIVYRTFVVWGSRIHIVLVPIGLLLGDIALGIWSAWTLAQTHTGHNPIAAAVSIRVRYFFVVTFSLNVLCAGLICWKIWSVHAEVPAYVSSVGRSPTTRAFEVIIETAALYCTHLLVLIVSDSAGSNVFFVFLDPLPPVTALVFTMIIVRTRTSSRLHATMTPSTWMNFWHGESGTSDSPPRTRAADVLTGIDEVPCTVVDLESADGRLKSRGDAEER